MIAALAVAACGLACGVGTLVLVLDSPGGSLAGASTVGLIALVGVGWLAIAVGLGDVRRRPGNRLGVLLVAVGFAWFVAEWNNPGAGSPVVFTLGLVLGAACPPLATHAAFSYPSGRLGSTVEHVVVATAYIGSLFVLGLGPALVFEPAEQGCGQCATNLVAVGNDPAVVVSLNRAGVCLGLGWALALGVLAVAAPPHDTGGAAGHGARTRTGDRLPGRRGGDLRPRPRSRIPVQRRRRPAAVARPGRRARPPRARRRCWLDERSSSPNSRR